MTRKLSRRKAVKRIGATGAVGVAALGFPAILKAQDVIKVGLTIPITGLEAILGEAMINCYTLAAEQLNAAGGVAGRQISLVIEDNQTSTKGCIDKARKLLGVDEVDVIMGGVLSLERQATMTVTAPAKKLFLYPTYYEGGECEKYLVCTGQVPNQQLDHFVPYLMARYGKTVYIVGSDYVWAQVSSKIITEKVQANGGQVVAVELFPFGTQDFAPSFQKIREANPDMVWVMVVGSDSLTMIKQYRSFEMPQELVSQAFDELFARLGFPEGELEGMLCSQSYFMTLDNPNNKAFLDAFKARFGPDKMVDCIAEACYCSLMLYARTAEKAGTTADDAVIAALGQVEFEAPQGRVSILNSNNHMICNSVIGRVRRDGFLDIVEELGRIEPVVPGCQLA
jgi:urea transport system substrate-binding protein